MALGCWLEIWPSIQFHLTFTVLEMLPTSFHVDEKNLLFLILVSLFCLMWYLIKWKLLPHPIPIMTHNMFNFLLLFKIWNYNSCHRHFRYFCSMKALSAIILNILHNRKCQYHIKLSFDQGNWRIFPLLDCIWFLLFLSFMAMMTYYGYLFNQAVALAALHQNYVVFLSLS